MVPDTLYLGHPPELIERAIVFPHGNFVEIDDLLFAQHGLGARFAQVATNNYRDHRSLSYAYWNLPDTTYDLITEHDDPKDLGSFDDLIANTALLEKLTTTFISRTDHMPYPRQLALALIRARKDGVQASDEVGLQRLVKWALIYERRAFWIAKNRQLALSKIEINWDALGL